MQLVEKANGRALVERRKRRNKKGKEGEGERREVEESREVLLYKGRTAYEMIKSLVSSERCIKER